MLQALLGKEAQSLCLNILFLGVEFPSPLIEKAVDQFASLPGIGRKTALRLVLHLLSKDKEEVENFSMALSEMKRKIRFCECCHNVSISNLCAICEDKGRDESIVCLVENLRDLISIENTGQFQGRYHILGGLISPINGVGPDDLNFQSLLQRCENSELKEIIVALSPTIDGDTTMFFLNKQLEGKDVQISSIARGVSFGGDLEYVDDLTLSRSIATRIPFEQTIIER